MAKAKKQRPKIILSPYGDVWERHEEESDYEWELFKTYRNDQHQRNVGRLGLQFKVDPVSMKAISDRNRWHERILAYDRHTDEVYIDELERKTKEMAVRHANIANAALGVLQAPIRELVARLSDGRINVRNMNDEKLLNMVVKSSSAIKSLIEVERISRGMHPRLPEKPSDKSKDINSPKSNQSVAQLVKECMITKKKSSRQNDVIDMDEE